MAGGHGRASWQGSARVRLATLALVAPLCCSDIPTTEEPDTYCTPETLSRFPGGWPLTLDAALYWFGRGDTPSKAVNSEKSAFYDPAKPTMIYFHGWTGADGGWTQVCKRMTTRCPSYVCPDDGGELLMEKWIDAGWNVGIFYWDQFADEDCTRDAEQKIWFDRGGDGFRWKSFDVNLGVASYDKVKENSVTLTDWCVRAMRTAMGNYVGPHVRFVGHSIGAQLATRCAAMLHNEEHPAAPQRLALLEPYFSKYHFSLFRCKKISTDGGIGDFTAAATADYVKSLYEQHKVVTEVYKSSVLTEMSQFGVPNEELDKLTTIVEYEPHWCGGLGPLSKADLGHLKCRHNAVFPLYFLSFGKSPPAINPPPPAEEEGAASSALSSCQTPSAACSYGQILEWIERQLKVGGRQKWVQDSGFETFPAGDDSFKLTPSLGEEAQVGELSANELVEQASPPEPLPVRKEPLWQKGVDILRHAVTQPSVLLLAALVVVVALGGLVYLSRLGGKDEDESDEDEDNPTIRSLMLEHSSSVETDGGAMPTKKAYEGLRVASTDQVVGPGV